MHIQYAGFSVSASSRIYKFDVIEPNEVREFTVEVLSETFRPARLKLQDGPGICFARVEQELRGETQELRAVANLSVGEQDIQGYMERHYPRKVIAKRQASSR